MWNVCNFFRWIQICSQFCCTFRLSPIFEHFSHFLSSLGSSGRPKWLADSYIQKPKYQPPPNIYEHLLMLQVYRRIWSFIIELNYFSIHYFLIHSLFSWSRRSEIHLAHRLDTSLTWALSLKVWHFLAIFRSLILEEGANCLTSARTMNTRGMWFARKCFHYNIPTGFFFYSFYLALPFFSMSLSIFQRRVHFIS